MIFELEYDANLRLNLDRKQWYRSRPGSVFVWMFIDEDLAGEAYGIPLEQYSDFEGRTEIPEGERKNGIYCFSNTILPAYRGLGFGKVLKAYWLGMADGRGFVVVYGHARPGPSQALNEKFGATFLRLCRNYAKTQETYKFYRLALNCGRTT
jgi:GNAT superfamily N-acetyltransferase